MKRQPIDPKDIRPGDCVDREHKVDMDGVTTDTRLRIDRVHSVDDEWVRFRKSTGSVDGYGVMRAEGARWFLVKRQPKLGSRWVDPETGQKYVVLDGTGSGYFYRALDYPAAHHLLPSASWDEVARLIPRREWKARNKSAGAS